MTPTARKICGVLAPFLTLILAFQPILFHIVVAEGHYLLCSIKGFFFKKTKSIGELFDYGAATVKSKVTHMLYGVHVVDTMFMFC